MTDKRTVVTICGSMRFEYQMRQAAVTESLAGAIVLLPLVNMRTPDPRWSAHDDAERVKAELDRLHLAKIDLADEVLVICPGGYIGRSTAAEIRHARTTGKTIRFHTGTQSTGQPEAMTALTRRLTTESNSLPDDPPQSVPCRFDCGYLAASEDDLDTHETDCDNAHDGGAAPCASA